jgi:cation transporter-like permease
MNRKVIVLLLVMAYPTSFHLGGNRGGMFSGAAEATDEVKSVNEQVQDKLHEMVGAVDKALPGNMLYVVMAGALAWVVGRNQQRAVLGAVLAYVLFPGEGFKVSWWLFGLAVAFFRMGPDPKFLLLGVAFLYSYAANKALV